MPRSEDQAQHETTLLNYLYQLYQWCSRNPKAILLFLLMATGYLVTKQSNDQCPLTNNSIRFDSEPNDGCVREEIASLQNESAKNQHDAEVLKVTAEEILHCQLASTLEIEARKVKEAVEKDNAALQKEMDAKQQETNHMHNMFLQTNQRYFLSRALGASYSDFTWTQITNDMAIEKLKNKVDANNKAAAEKMAEIRNGVDGCASKTKEQFKVQRQQALQRFQMQLFSIPTEPTERELAQAKNNCKMKKF